ncbi:MAG TPA: DUF4282 domain-containing protein [Intrasporangium sp.]|nr:DUF4282 domain-containing protein [Intrasporangium sp.]
MSDQHGQGSFDREGSQPSYGQPADPTTPIPSSPSPEPTRSATRQQEGSPMDGALGVARDTTGFLPALFDFTFTHFVTPKLVRFVYLLATIALGVVWLFWVFVGFARGAGTGLAVLILGPVLFIIYLAVIRMTLEFYLSIVRMSEDVHHRLPRA